MVLGVRREDSLLRYLLSSELVEAVWDSSHQAELRGDKDPILFVGLLSFFFTLALNLYKRLF